MKLLFDLFPVILFFVAFKLVDIYVATAVAIAATVVQIGWLRLKHGQVEIQHLLSLGIIVVFGGATLLFQDETFIKWKPTVLYWLFAASLLGASLFLKKNLMKSMLGKQMTLPDAVWKQVNLSWAGFFTFMGLANLFVAYQFSTDTWVNFKLFGGMGLMLIFIVIQGMLLSRHVEEQS